MLRSSQNNGWKASTAARHLAALRRQARPASDRTADASPQASDAIQDWDDLFEFMRASLGETRGEPLDLPHGRRRSDKAPSLTPALLQRLAVLHRLHPAVLHRLDRQAQIELDLVNAHQALARLRGDLIGAGFGTGQAPVPLPTAAPLQPDRDLACERLDRALAGAAAGRAALVVVHLDQMAIESAERAVGRGARAALVGLVTSRLRLVIQPGDAICRIAEGDFACLLADAGNREALILMVWRLFDAAASPFAFGGREISVRPTLGVAVAPASAATAAAMLAQAEQAAANAWQCNTRYEFFDPVSTPAAAVT